MRSLIAVCVFVCLLGQLKAKEEQLIFTLDQKQVIEGEKSILARGHPGYVVLESHEHKVRVYAAQGYESNGKWYKTCKHPDIFYDYKAGFRLTSINNTTMVLLWMGYMGPIVNSSTNEHDITGIQANFTVDVLVINTKNCEFTHVQRHFKNESVYYFGEFEIDIVPRNDSFELFYRKNVDLYKMSYNMELKKFDDPSFLYAEFSWSLSPYDNPSLKTFPWSTGYAVLSDYPFRSNVIWSLDFKGKVINTTHFPFAFYESRPYSLSNDAMSRCSSVQNKLATCYQFDTHLNIKNNVSFKFEEETLYNSNMVMYNLKNGGFILLSDRHERGNNHILKLAMVAANGEQTETLAFANVHCSNDIHLPLHLFEDNNDMCVYFKCKDHWKDDQSNIRLKCFQLKDFK